MRVAVAIPARLRSSRLPRKVLSDIGGQSMLRRTYQVALEAGCGPVVVLTDADEVAEEARSFGAAVMMTEPALDSGTSRIASIVGRLEAQIVVNLQADTPLLDPEVVARSVRETTRTGASVTLPVSRICDSRTLHDTSVVKVVRGHDGRALYCSRAPLPHVRDVRAESWVDATGFWAHVGLYTYRREFLEGFWDLPPSALEQAERLEQLRWLEAGVSLHTFEVEQQAPSVDTAADLERVRSLVVAEVSP
jgi:3-deoxy-manno-octulosonate cytidylyltransferase (CMP-KDO synthetase)